MPGKRSSSTVHKPEDKHVFGKDTTNKITSAIGKVAEYAASGKAKKVLSSVNALVSILVNMLMLR